MRIDETWAPPEHDLAALADLTWLNIGDICSAFGLPSGMPLRGLAEAVAHRPARRFAEHLLSLDQHVGTHGLQAGATWICEHYSDAVQLQGPTPPRTGPLLIIANHPGLLDAAALFTAIPRPDLRVLAITRPLLRALPQIRRHLLAVGTEPSTRTTALRQAARHLQAGGALLTFPAGQIEPDPMHDLTAAHASLATWSSSIDLLMRLAGPVTVQVAIVGGVIAPQTLQHPLTRFHQTPQARQYLAAILQLLRPNRYRVRVRVQRGEPWLDQSDQAQAVAAPHGRIQTMAYTLMQAISEP
ncbi:MAG: glycerol acyltransferase [Oscillochloridaceae bacterium umkhey_bin13]